MLPQHKKARALMTAVAIAVGRPAVDKAWPWPEPRLSYANAVLPEALLAAGAVLDSPSLVADGLGLLGWLLDGQTRDGHLSVVPAGGRGPGEIRPRVRPAADRGGRVGRRLRTGTSDRRTAAVGRGGRARRGMVPRRQRLRHPDARPGERGRLRRSGAHRPQREPGRGVHVGAARDAAAGSLDGAARAPEGQELVEERRMTECVTRTDVVLTADPTRVLARLFVPGHELSLDGRSRASGVMARILALPEDEVGATLSRVRDRYAKRHRDLPGVLAGQLRADRPPGTGRRRAVRRAPQPGGRLVHPRVLGRGGGPVQPVGRRRTPTSRASCRAGSGSS